MLESAIQPSIGGTRRPWRTVLALLSAVMIAGCTGATTAPTSAPGTPAASGAQPSGAQPSGAQPSVTGTGLLAQIQQTGTIRVCMAIDPPFGLRDANGNWYSFTPDLTVLLAQNMGVKVNFVPVGWTTIVAALQANQCDMIGASISATPERQKVIDFSIPYAYGGTTWFVLKGNSKNLATLNDLNNPSVTVSFQAGTFQDQITTRLLPNCTQRAITNATTADLVSELAAHRADAISVPSFLDAALMQQFPAYLPIPSDLKGQEPTGIAWGVNKGHQDLVDLLNQFIKTETDNGTIPKLQTQDLTIKNALAG